MTRSKQPATAAVAPAFPSAEATDMAQLVEDLDGMLTRLRLGAIRVSRSSADFRNSDAAQRVAAEHR